jgi:hypothetical protein
MNTNRFKFYLHLRPFVLEPEFNLLVVQAKFPAKISSLLLIRMRTLLEETENNQEQKISIKNVFSKTYRVIKPLSTSSQIQ